MLVQIDMSDLQKSSTIYVNNNVKQLFDELFLEFKLSVIKTTGEKITRNSLIEKVFSSAMISGGTVLECKAIF